jgi:hypothetical protein
VGSASGHCLPHPADGDHRRDVLGWAMMGDPAPARVTCFLGPVIVLTPSPDGTRAASTDADGPRPFPNRD